jgi:hypothetical protein
MSAAKVVAETKDREGCPYSKVFEIWKKHFTALVEKKSRDMDEPTSSDSASLTIAKVLMENLDDLAEYDTQTYVDFGKRSSDQDPSSIKYYSPSKTEALMMAMILGRLLDHCRSEFGFQDMTKDMAKFLVSIVMRYGAVVEAVARELRNQPVT